MSNTSEKFSTLIQSLNVMEGLLFDKIPEDIDDTGFDYSWKHDGKYYAFDEDAGGKRYYMRHVYGISGSGKLIYTSNNLNTSIF